MQDWFEIAEKINFEHDYALALLFQTEGNSYKKSGAIALVNPDECIGLISGGCLEDDLRLRSKAVIDNNQPALIKYDLKDDDELFGLGAGCEGILDIYLMPLLVQNEHANFKRLLNYAIEPKITESIDGSDDGKTSTIVASFTLSEDSVNAINLYNDKELYHSLLNHPESRVNTTSHGITIYQLPLIRPREIVIGGAGNDCYPLVHGALELGWRVILVDHRKHYLSQCDEKFLHRKGFSSKHIKLEAPVQDELEELLTTSDALIVMTHKVQADVNLVHYGMKSSVKYIGLLGPKLRAKKILKKIPASILESFRGLLSSPVGLDIGSYSPASIALSILSELHQFFFKPKSSDSYEHYLMMNLKTDNQSNDQSTGETCD